MEIIENEKDNMQKAMNIMQSKLNRQDAMQTYGMDVSESRIQELEKENTEKDKEIAELMKKSEVVKDTLEENKKLKDQLDEVNKEKDDVLVKVRELEDQFKNTQRRLSKSYNNDVDLNDTVSMEMFQEPPPGSPPFHGYPSQTERPNQDSLKRNRSSIGNISNKRFGRHPTIGSKIIVETLDGRSSVYTVESKKSPSKGDYVYQCIGNDNKPHTFNFKRTDWGLFDGGEKIPVKSQSQGTI